MHYMFRACGLPAIVVLALPAQFGCSSGPTSDAAGSSNLGLGLAGRGGDQAAIDRENLLPDDLECAGGPVGEIRVRFECDAFTVVTCRDLSNVVLEYEDGTRERYEGLKGQTGSFTGNEDNAGKVIAHVWIKAGGNLSGEGPGYGTRFDAPEDTCDPPDDDEAPPGDGNPPGEDDTCDGPDNDCAPSSPTPDPVECDETTDPPCGPA